ncbi:MAG: putative universal stress protein [Syntrophus sp. PtaB.Bin138]|jgi:nucleotide-binding universal stress UspA family protein|nr:MAG: putative universal stress protein [Syntrophus sp. PtaB.Bin138]
MDFMKHILVVSWLTKHCDKTIQIGISLAQKYKAGLSVIHVIDTTWLKGWSIPMVSIEQEHKKDMEKRKAELHEIINAEKMNGMEIKEFIREGVSSEIIMKLIEEENFDLLILRSHAESRLERMLVGGSNDEIIRAMPCSVFLVKQEVCMVD